MTATSTTTSTMSRNAIVFEQPRLPYHENFQEKLGISLADWRTLCEVVWPSAKTPDAVLRAFNYCRARKLDPLKKMVHVVPMWDKAKNQYIETVWPGIAEMRTTAARTREYAGCDKPEFGPTLKREFKGSDRRGNNYAATVEFPEWCQITVYRLLGGHRCPFPGPKVYWSESFSDIAGSGVPNSMWQKRPIGQLEKCAEAAALRRAFPEELGGDMIAEEAEGKIIEHDVHDNALTLPQDTQELLAPPPIPSGTEGSPSDPLEPPKTSVINEPTVDVPSTAVEPDLIQPAQGAATVAAETAPARSPEEIVAAILDSIACTQSLVEIDEVLDAFAADLENLPRPDSETISHAVSKRKNHITQLAEANNNPPLSGDPLALPEFKSEKHFLAWFDRAIQAAADGMSECKLFIGAFNSCKEWRTDNLSPLEYDKTIKRAKAVVERVKEKAVPDTMVTNAPAEPPRANGSCSSWDDYVKQTEAAITAAKTPQDIWALWWTRTSHIRDELKPDYAALEKLKERVQARRAELNQ